MITFKKFLLEKEETINSRNPQELADLIKRDCKKWLNEVSDISEYKIFRGTNSIMKRPESILYKKDVRKNRQPKDTSKAVHDIFDEYFEKNFGWKMRSESLFVTGDESIASEYGYAYMVLPIGDYNYCWSPKVPDLTGYFEYEVRKRVQNAYNEKKISDYDAELLIYTNSHLPFSVWNIDRVSFDYKKLTFQILDDGEYTDINLKRAIKTKNELMIACDSYYVFNNINERNVEIINEVLGIL